VSTQATLPLDPARLEQLLQMQERLLLGAVDDAALGDRLCQGTALVVGAASVRLLAPLAAGGVTLRGSYASARHSDNGRELDATDVALVRRALAERRPVVAIDDTGGSVLTLPLDVASDPLAMQLRPLDGNGFALEWVSLARCAAALAAVALKRAHEPAAVPKDPQATEVLASLSHDLRQPLNVMLGYTQLLIDDTYGPCNPEQREVLTTIERHARELHVVLTGALELVRLENQPVATTASEPFAVEDVLRELCTGSLKHRATHDVALTWHVAAATPPLRSDRFRLRQVLQNLLDNALRHTERGEVAVTAAPHDGQVRLQVSDTGTGIAADDLPHVFTPFHTGSRGRTGSGLGLYIVKRFCESLGGQITVASTVGAGTRFTIDVPTHIPAR
jgi:signal transduction histidine kinase